MPIDPDALANFRRGARNDSFLGIIGEATNMLYLALAERLDKAAIPPERHSMIKEKRRDPLPVSGGHATLAGWVGIAANQVAPGVAVGNAFGFSLIKTGPAAFTIGTFRSGFNQQYLEAKPAYAQGTPNAARTLDQERILNRLLPELTAGLLGRGVRESPI